MSNSANVGITSLFHILIDGTVVSSRHTKNPGERYQKPGTPNFVEIKFSNISNQEYTVVTENVKAIAYEWEIEKQKVLKARTGWNSVSQKAVMQKLYNQFVAEGEPLMKESFFLAMKHFKP